MRSNQFVDKVCARCWYSIDFGVLVLSQCRSKTVDAYAHAKSWPPHKKRYLSLSKPDRFRWSAGTCRGVLHHHQRQRGDHLRQVVCLFYLPSSPLRWDRVWFFFFCIALLIPPNLDQLVCHLRMVWAKSTSLWILEGMFAMVMKFFFEI